jgi:hypothetical protein
MGQFGGGQFGGQSGQQSGPHTGKGPRNFKRSDERLNEEISERLMQHGQIDASNIDVEVRGGEVYLRGEVDDRQTKRMAEDILDDVMGITEVHNELRISRGRQGQSGGQQGQSGQQEGNGQRSGRQQQGQTEGRGREEQQGSQRATTASKNK